MSDDGSERTMVRLEGMAIWTLVLAVLIGLQTLIGVASAGSGTATISAVVDNGDGSYTLTLSSTSGMTVGDHLGAKLSSGRGSIYEITSLVSGTSAIVSDTLTEEEGSAFGAPATGDAWYATPTTNLGLSRLPYTAKGWDAPLRRNAKVVDAQSFYYAGGTDVAVTDGGTGASTAADARTNLGLAIGTDVQAYDAQLADVAGLTPTDGNFIVGDGANFTVESGATARTSLGLGSISTQAASSVAITGGSVTGITDLTVADGGTGASDASTARTNLGLVIGTDVQAYDAELAALAGLTSAADKLAYFTGSGTAALTDFSSFARTLVDDTTASDARTTLGVAIGTDVQAYSAALGTIASITTAVHGSVLFHTGAGWIPLSPGTSGYVLQTNGSDASPTWAAAPGPSSVTYVDSMAQESYARLSASTAIGSPFMSYSGLIDSTSCTLTYNTISSSVSTPGSGHAAQMATDVNAGDEAGFAAPTGASLWRLDQYPHMVTKWAVGSNTNTRTFVGMADQNLSTMLSADEPTGNYVGLQAREADTNWYFVVRDGSTMTRTDTGVARDTNVHYLVVDISSTSSYTLKLLDSTRAVEASTTFSSNLPASTSVFLSCGGTETRTTTFKYFYFYFNHVQIRPQ